MRQLPRIISILIVICIAVCSCGEKANKMQEISDKYHSGEISSDSMLTFISDSTNIELVNSWAEKNKDKDDLAAYILGRIYKFGIGVDRNPNKSIYYYRKAVEKENINAMLGLAHLYSGYPGYENIDSAKLLYNQAAKLGEGSAFYYLSQFVVLESQRNGTPLDTTAVLSLVEKGMKLNDPTCIGMVAASYYSGEGYTQDKKKAFNILSLLSENKLSPQSLIILGECYELGEVVGVNYNSAFHYYKKAADMGETYAICKVGNFYELGQGVEKNDSLAFVEYRKAANAGNPWAMRCVSNCYLSGRGVKEDVASGKSWAAKAAKHGDELAIQYCKRFNIDYSK